MTRMLSRLSRCSRRSASTSAELAALLGHKRRQVDVPGDLSDRGAVGDVVGAMPDPQHGLRRPVQVCRWTSTCSTRCRSGLTIASTVASLGLAKRGLGPIWMVSDSASADIPAPASPFPRGGAGLRPSPSHPIGPLRRKQVADCASPTPQRRWSNRRGAEGNRRRIGGISVEQPASAGARAEPGGWRREPQPRLVQPFAAQAGGPQDQRRSETY